MEGLWGVMREIVICADGCCINGVARMMMVGCWMEWERGLEEIYNLFNNSGKICSIIEMWEAGR